MDVLYREVVADSSSVSGFDFEIQAPTFDAVLDNEVLIEYTVSAGSTDFAAQFGDFTRETLAQEDEFVAFRQCWPMSRSLASVEVTLNNNTTYRTHPNQWIDAMNRVSISHEESKTTCSMAGGEFDSGAMWALSEHELTLKSQLEENDFPPGAVVFNVSTNIQVIDKLGSAIVLAGVGDRVAHIITSDMPRIEEFYNKGYQNRVHKFIREARLVGAVNAAVGPAGATFGGQNEFTRTLWERVPCAPFHFYDSFDTKGVVKDVRHMTVRMSWVSDVRTNSLQGSSSGNSTLDWYTVKPKMHLKWMIPKLKLEKPKMEMSKMMVSFMKTDRQLVKIQGIGLNDVMDTYETVEFKQRYLSKLPKFFAIFLKRDVQLIEGASEHFASIRKLVITIGGSAKVVHLSQGMMYALYMKNAFRKGMEKFDYNNWRKHGCVCLVTPQDLGIHNVFNGLSIHISAEVRTFWAQPHYNDFTRVILDPAGDVDYQFTVVSGFEEEVSF